MVKFRQHDDDDAAEYWMLKKYTVIQGSSFYGRSCFQRELKKLNFATTGSVTNERLSYLATRAERGLMSYEKQSVKDLSSFCNARKIAKPKGSPRTKATYIKVLEDADEEGTTFGGFLDLPPELRLRVYSYYMDFLGRPIPSCGIQLKRFRTGNELCTSKVAVPPPISHVCSLLRKESMPVFFDVFRLDLTRFARFDQFLSNILPKFPVHLLVEHVKKIRFGVCLSLVYCAMDIDLATPLKPGRFYKPKVDQSRLFHMPQVQKSPAFCKALEDTMEQEICQRFASNGGHTPGMQLTGQDFDAFYRIVRTSLLRMSGSGL